MPDIAPTLLELAGLAPLPTMDGRSLAGFLADGAAARAEAARGWREEILVEYIATQATHTFHTCRFDNLHATARTSPHPRDVLYLSPTDALPDLPFDLPPYLARSPSEQEGVKEDKFGHILDSGNATFRVCAASTRTRGPRVL